MVRTHRIGRMFEASRNYEHESVVARNGMMRTLKLAVMTSVSRSMKMPRFTSKSCEDDDGIKKDADENSTRTCPRSVSWRQGECTEVSG